MREGIVACPVHGDNETTSNCPNCRPYSMKNNKTLNKILDEFIILIKSSEIVWSGIIVLIIQKLHLKISYFLIGMLIGSWIYWRKNFYK